MIDTTAQNTLKNSLYNLLGFVLPILVILFITPIIISHWGAKDYGLYIFLNTLIVFLGLLDLGVSIGTSKHIIEYRSIGDERRLKKMLHSMNSVYLILAFVYLLACTSVGVIIQLFFIDRVGTSNNYLIIFFILGIIAFINAVIANFSNILFTLQRNDLQVKISMVFMLISNASLLVLVLSGFGLLAVLVVQLFLSLLNNIVYFFTARNIFPLMRLKYEWVQEEILKNYRFGLSVAFNNLASSSLVHFDKLLIPVFLGNAQLTYYSVPGSVATKISSISSTFSSLLFPITVNLNALHDTEKIKRVYIRSMRLIIILSSAISLSITFIADKILLYWLDDTFAKQSSMVLILLVMTNFILALYGPLSNLLTALNKIKFLTIGSLIMASINILCLFVLLPKYGISGAALSYLISVLFIFWMLKYSEKNYFGIRESLHEKLILKIVATAIPFYLIVTFLLYPYITSMVSLIFIGPACVGLFMVLYKLFGFVEPEDWNDFRISSTKIMQRLNLIK